MAPFEGLHRPLGYEVLFAVKLALQERNAKGGVAGYQIELVALNDFDEPQEAGMQARALVTDPAVLGIVGHLSADTTRAALPVYQAADLAVSIPWTIADLPERDQAGLVTVAASETETLARLEAVAQARGLPRRSTLTGLEFDHPIDSGVDAVTLMTDAVTAGEIVLAFKQKRLDLPLFGGANVGSPQLIQVADLAANGLIFVSPGPDPAGVPDAAEFVVDYEALAAFPPGPRAVLAYDATHVLLDAIEAAIVARSGELPARAEIAATINRIRRRGLSGDFSFDNQGRRVAAPVWIYQISDGTYPGGLISP